MDLYNDQTTSRQHRICDMWDVHTHSLKTSQMLFFSDDTAKHLTTFLAGVAFTTTNLPTISLLPAFVAGFVFNFSIHLPKIDLTLACKAFPCAVLPPTGQNPVMPNSFRAFLTASPKARNAGGMVFLARAEAALLTILPFLFLIKDSLVRPPDVFCFEPRKTRALRNLPRATLLAALFFIAFMPFMLFIAAFMAFMPPM